MSWISTWWQRDVLEGHRGPLLLSFVAFVLTFIITRTITRLIRAGKGPFRNMDSGGVHLHHSTPGVILLVAGAFISVAALSDSPMAYVGATLVGVGASLVLDEFAMIFHLKDVYWSQEGQLSVNIVTLSAALVGLGVVGVSPFNVDGLSQTATELRIGVSSLMVLNLGLVATTALKGKYPTALFGLFLWPLLWIGAIRLARPNSRWAHWFYPAKRKAHAARRATEFDHRWAPVRARWDDFIGGTPTATPAAAAPSDRRS